MTATHQHLDVRPTQGGLHLHIREWAGDKTPFMLIHGLASNCRTWDAVADLLAAAGHRVITFDQRGHGLSDKPNHGYDFATITDDLARLLDLLKLERLVLAGQSWGGNVLLEFGARFPGRASHLWFVDGGTIDLQAQPGATWESMAQMLRPPNLLGTPRSALKARIQSAHPDWTEAGVEATLANFETLPDGTIRPWLTLERHMLILRAMWDQRPQELYGKVTEPVSLAVALEAAIPEWNERKREQVMAAQIGLQNMSVHWFEETAHDIHVHRPQELAQFLLKGLER